MIFGRCLAWKITSDLQNVEAVCQEASQLLEQAALTQFVFLTDLLLREFINNAILHGNNQNHEKYVQVILKLKRQWMLITVTDEGKGFDWRAKLKQTPAVADVSGRGLFIARQYGARIKYNSAGNKVALRIKLKGGNIHDGI